MANTSGLPSSSETLQINGVLVQLQVIPIAALPQQLRHFVVLFEEIFDANVSTPPVSYKKPAAIEPDTEQGQQLARLQQHLAATKAYLQSVIQGKDVTNEELKAANEEVISSNEELQSTNEELETAKEELQSTNEEMETVNEELVSRIRTSIELNDELTNLIAGVKIPILIVGSDLRVRRFSPRACEVFNLIAADVGRPVSDLSLQINISDLQPLIRNVIDTLEVHEQEVTVSDGYWYLLSIRPFRTSDNRIDGVILYLTDINAIKKREKDLVAARDFSRCITETLHESWLLLDDKLRVRQANPVFYETFQISRELTENQIVFSLGDGQWNIPELRQLLNAVLSSNGELLNFRVEREFPKLGKRAMLLNARRLVDETHGEHTNCILLSIEDVTAREEAVHSLRNVEHLMHSIVDAAVCAIITINEKGIIQTFNRAAEGMFGFETADAIGKSLKMLMPQHEGVEVEGILLRYMTTGVKRIIGIGRDVIGQRQDGATFPLHLDISEINVSGERLFIGILVETSERRKLERQVLEIASEEQRRIGQDLHDTTGQELTGLTYLTQTLVESLKAKNAAESKQAIRILTELESALSHVRQISKGLSPVDVHAEGLMTALQELAARTHEITKIPTEFRCKQTVTVHDSHIATELFLVAREAVNNIIKHAHANHIRITLKQIQDDVFLEVWDDGIGIPMDKQSGGIGLQIMAYRASALHGSLKIERNGTVGSRVVCRIPVKAHQ